MRIIHDAQVTLDNCASSEAVAEVIISTLGQEYSNAITRGVRCRLLYDTTEDGMNSCRDLIKLGFEVRHLSNLVGTFFLSEKELLGAALKGSSNQSGIGFNLRRLSGAGRQHHLVFDMLWGHATPCSEGI